MRTEYAGGSELTYVDSELVKLGKAIGNGGESFKQNIEVSTTTMLNEPKELEAADIQKKHCKDHFQCFQVFKVFNMNIQTLEFLVPSACLTFRHF